MRFTRKLTHEEQRQLSPGEEREYWDWLFTANEPVCQARERRDNSPSKIGEAEREAAADHRYAHREKEDWWAGVEKKVNI